MGAPRVQLPVVGASWITRLIPTLGIIILYRIFSQEVFTLRSNPRQSFMAVVAASSASHGKAASIVDLSWHAPNATNINDLSQVIGGSGIYGFIYNSSATPANEYGIYNWCNMPHVRATEYNKPSSEYKLQYVEVVSQSGPIEADRGLLMARRFTDITNARYTLRTLSLSNHMAGIVTMKDSFAMGSRRQGRNLHTHTGRAIFHPRIPLLLRDSLERVNSRR
jgi:hypothetical protein